MSDWLCITDAYDFIHIDTVVMQNKLINIVDAYMDWLLFVAMMEIAECYSEGDCWLCYRPWGRLLIVSDSDGDCWL